MITSVFRLSTVKDIRLLPSTDLQILPPDGSPLSGAAIDASPLRLRVWAITLQANTRTLAVDGVYKLDANGFKSPTPLMQG
jgi:hypothetical protein